MICFFLLSVISAKFQKFHKFFFHFGRDPADPSFSQVDPKIGIFISFTNFFQNYWIAAKVINVN